MDRLKMIWFSLIFEHETILFASFIRFIWNWSINFIRSSLFILRKTTKIEETRSNSSWISSTDLHILILIFVNSRLINLFLGHFSYLHDWFFKQKNGEQRPTAKTEWNRWHLSERDAAGLLEVIYDESNVTDIGFTFPVLISTTTQPTDQMSAALPWPSPPVKTSGAM